MAARAEAATRRATGGRRAAARSRGRPPAAPERDLRADLLAAARELFLRYGYRAVSARQVAAKAGANPAMVHYYFRSKQGLYTAMLREATAPLVAALEEMLAPEAPGTPDLPALMAAYMRVIGRHPWIPGLLLREVFAPEGAYREDFIREFAGRIGPRVVELIRRGVGAGRLRADLDPQLALVSFLSLALFPFIARPVLGRVLGQKFDEDGLEALIGHSTRLFAAGTAAGAAK
jgi:AcrR family transcriptional regulator